MKHANGLEVIWKKEIADYRENCGFLIKNSYMLYEKGNRPEDPPKIAFGKKDLRDLVAFREGDLTPRSVVFVADLIEGNSISRARICNEVGLEEVLKNYLVQQVVQVYWEFSDSFSGEKT